MKVKITYYKQSGKYYSAGEYVSGCTAAYGPGTEVRKMFALGVNPGLVDGAFMRNNFVAHVEYEHEMSVPFVITKGAVIREMRRDNGFEHTVIDSHVRDYVKDIIDEVVPSLHEA